MINMNKILELSKKIADAGFEPDMWVHYIGDGDNSDLTYCWKTQAYVGQLVVANRKSIDQADGEYDSYSKTPYFTADWCWKMLPQQIKRREEHETLSGEFSDYIVIYSLVLEKDKKKTKVWYTEISHGDWLKGLHCTQATSPHEALLEMVCWTIDNGFLKGEK